MSKQSSFGFYIGFDDGLYCMNPSQASHNLFVNNVPKQGECDGGLTAFDPRCRPWYNQTLNSSDDGIMTRPYLSASPEYVLTSQHAKILDSNGKPLGVVGFDLNIEGLQLISNLDMKIPDKYYYFLIDS